MNQEVLLVSSSSGGNITAWDVRTGTQLTTYKGNSCPPNGISLLGKDYLIATQLGKPALHAWTWHKDQVHQRSFPPESITALACTSNGAYIAGGGISGAIHIWEASSGRLLRSWPAHYKKVTCLAFSDSGMELVTGGEDTLVTAWLLAEVLDTGAAIAQLGGPSLAPLHSWSDHTLPVTCVAVGSGGCNALVFSTSADRSLKIRILGSGVVLRSVTFPAPLTALAIDPGEHDAYVGSSNGRIYEVPLVGSIYGSNGTESGTEEERKWIPMEGHSQTVTCLSVTADAAHLVSGSDDTSVMVWDLRSRQPVRTISAPAKGPVSAVVLVQRPDHMPAGTTTGGKKGPSRMEPLAQLSKYPGQSGGLKPWEGGLVLLDGSGEAVAMEEVGGAGGGGGNGGAGHRESNGGAVAVNEAGTSNENNDMDALREENAKLKEQAERAMALAEQWGKLNAELQKELAESSGR